MLFMDSDSSYLSIEPTWIYADIQCQRYKNNAENPKDGYPIVERGREKTSGFVKRQMLDTPKVQRLSNLFTQLLSVIKEI